MRILMAVGLMLCIFTVLVSGASAASENNVHGSISLSGYSNAIGYNTPADATSTVYTQVGASPNGASDMQYNSHGSISLSGYSNADAIGYNTPADATSTVHTQVGASPNGLTADVDTQASTSGNYESTSTGQTRSASIS